MVNQSSLKILNAVPDERFGGPQQRVLQVAKKLKNDSISTIVVMPCGDQTFAGMLYDAGIPHLQLKSFRRLPNPSNPVGVFLWFCFFLPCVIVLFRLIRSEKVDIVHANGGLNIQVSLAAKLAGAKLLWHLNDVRSPKLLKWLLLALFRILPDEVVVASAAVEKCYYGERSTGRMVVLYPPVNTEDFYPDESRSAEYREEFGISSEEKVVGIVGNLNPFKGYEHFLKSVKIIKQNCSQARFLIVGKKLDTHNAYWNKLRSIVQDLRLQDDLIWTNHRTDISGIMNGMDVFVLSSILEAAPIVVLEAMASARPIVATAVGGVPELIVNGESGILVSPGDPEAIANAVQYLLTHQEKAQEMGEKARERAIREFDLSVCVQRHSELYNSLIRS